MKNNKARNEEAENKKEDNFLLYIPKKKHETWEERKGKVYLVFYHDKWMEKFARWLVKKPYVSDMELDDLGSSVWKLIDGKNSIYDIGKKLIDKYGDKCEPVYDRLTLYIRYLNRKGWISFQKNKEN